MESDTASRKEAETGNDSGGLFTSTEFLINISSIALTFDQQYGLY